MRGSGNCLAVHRGLVTDGDIEDRRRHSELLGDRCGVVGVITNLVGGNHHRTGSGDRQHATSESGRAGHESVREHPTTRCRGIEENVRNAIGGAGDRVEADGLVGLGDREAERVRRAGEQLLAGTIVFVEDSSDLVITSDQRRGCQCGITISIKCGPTEQSRSVVEAYGTCRGCAGGVIQDDMRSQGNGCQCGGRVGGCLERGGGGVRGVVDGSDRLTIRHDRIGGSEVEFELFKLGHRGTSSDWNRDGFIGSISRRPCKCSLNWRIVTIRGNGRIVGRGVVQANRLQAG